MPKNRINGSVPSMESKKKRNLDSSDSTIKGKRKKTSEPSAVSSSSIIACEYADKVRELRKTIPCWSNMFSEEVNINDRIQAWMRLEVLGQPLLEKYAWAIPNEQALTICSSFGPLVEIGCGQGYWAKLLQEFGVDILALDKYTASKNTNKKNNKNKKDINNDNKQWLQVEYGDPKSLLRKDLCDRTLLLCYPDQAEAMAIECLEHYQGDIIIHIGELLVTGTGTKTGGSQAPWGRTTSADFQVNLAEKYHCVLQYKIPSFPFANDYITVWKKTKWTPGRSEEMGPDASDSDIDSVASYESKGGTGAAGSRTGGEQGHRNHNSDSSGSEEGSDDDEDRDCWQNIPDNERLPHPNVAAPMFQHLFLPKK